MARIETLAGQFCLWGLVDHPYGHGQGEEVVAGTMIDWYGVIWFYDSLLFLVLGIVAMFNAMWIDKRFPFEKKK